MVIMDYIGPVAGSPLIPFRFIFFYFFLSIFLLFSINLILFIRYKRSLAFIFRIKVFLLTVFSTQILLMTIVFSIAAYWLVPKPTIISSELQENDQTGNYMLEITFNKPVSRQQLKKSIEPEVPGLWVFEDPVYATHLYRKLVFYPQFTLQPETNYKVTLSGIRNLWQITKSEDYIFAFTTQLSSILGIESQESVFKLDVPILLQEHALSCEIAALRMALTYRGVNVSEDELLSKLHKDPTPHLGFIWGNPYVGFVGNVNGRQMVSGYGVYWGPIAELANKYRYAKSFEGWDTARLTQAIENNYPVVIWVYINNGKPTYWYTPSGDKIYAVPDEHAVTVVGFMGTAKNPSYVIVNDPLVGQTYWTREMFEDKWGIFGRSGVLVY